MKHEFQSYGVTPLPDDVVELLRYSRRDEKAIRKAVQHKLIVQDSRGFILTARGRKALRHNPPAYLPKLTLKQAQILQKMAEGWVPTYPADHSCRGCWLTLGNAEQKVAWQDLTVLAEYADAIAPAGRNQYGTVEYRLTEEGAWLARNPAVEL